MTNLFLFLLFMFLGIFFLYMGISGYLGYRKRSYIQWYYYGYIAGSINYGAIPLGIMFIMWAFIFTIPIPESLGLILTCVSSGIGFVGVLLGMIQPDFMLPEWYRWLKTTHKDIMPWLRKDVERMGYDEWQKRTDTQEGLETWVEEVRKKHGL